MENKYGFKDGARGRDGEGRNFGQAPAGRYQARLTGITVKEFANRFKEKSSDPEIVKKLIYSFELKNPKGEAGVTYAANKFVSLAWGEKSNNYKFLKSISESGDVPDSAIIDPGTFSQFMDSHIGKWFMVQVDTQGEKYNGIVTAMPIETPAGELDQAAWLKKSEADGKGKEGRKAIHSGKAKIYVYDITKIDAKNREAALTLLKKFDAEDAGGENQFCTLTEIKKLSKYLVPEEELGGEDLSFEQDEIPF